MPTAVVTKSAVTSSKPLDASCGQGAKANVVADEAQDKGAVVAKDKGGDSLQNSSTDVTYTAERSRDDVVAAAPVMRELSPVQQAGRHRSVAVAEPSFKEPPSSSAEEDVRMTRLTSSGGNKNAPSHAGGPINQRAQSLFQRITGFGLVRPSAREFVEDEWDEDEAFEEFMAYVDEEKLTKPVPPPDYKALYEELRHAAVKAAEMPGRDWLAGQLSLCQVLTNQDVVLGKTKLVEGYL